MVLVATACAGLAGSEDPAYTLARQQPPVFRAGTDVVLVNVLVTRGRTPVTGLVAADFVLRDTGVRQEIDVIPLRERAIDVTFVSSAVFESQYDELTGGSLHHVSTGADAFQRILDEFRSGYLLRYTPRGVDRAGWHEIEAKVTRPGPFTVRARKGYEGR
jgi:hypothetical protein